MHDAIRNILNIRQRRTRSPAGPRPRLGAKIAMDDFRMVVQSGMSEGLWRFLLQAGFREITYRGDRRAYRDVPPSLVAKLCKTRSGNWQKRLLAALQEAAKRPRVRLNGHG
jgi:hypothetical protein